jgi:putative restriction endonuclease
MPPVFKRRDIVKIRADLLDEIDGPMLQYGLEERHGQ